VPRLPRAARSAGFRFALLHTLVFVALVAVIGLTAEALVTHALKRQARARIESEAAELFTQYRERGPEHLRKLVSARFAMRENRLHYAILGRDGQVATGDPVLAQASRDEAGPGGSVVHEIGRNPYDTMLAAVRPLSDGSLLVAAIDLDSVEDVEDVVSGAFYVVLAMSLALGLGTGLLLSRTLLNRLDAVTRTAEAINAGDLSRRIARTGSGDDFDRLSATLNLMLDRICALMESVRQVSNDVAHDLRTPLARLRQTLEDARRHSGTMADYDAAVAKAMVEADGLLATFSALLRIAQIEAGARRSAFQAVDLTDTIQTVCEAYAPTIEDGGRPFAVALAPGITVEGDRELLTQLFANLLENAIGHTPAGTGIRVELERSDDGRFGHASVSDAGPGIPTPEREKVFRRFYRLEQSRTTPGNGLGLSMAAAIADLHQTRMSLSDNRPGLRVGLDFRLGG